jgi:hypothetical protein
MPLKLLQLCPLVQLRSELWISEGLLKMKTFTEAQGADALLRKGRRLEG